MTTFLTSGDLDSPRIILAHGAGAPMDSPFMETMASGLASKGLFVVRFEFPYMRARREGKRRPPDRAATLESCWLDALESAPGNGPGVIGGKSMGGRIASMVADRAGVTGLVCLGYPFHPPGKPDNLRTEHLATIETPTLIVQGDRDALGSRDEVGGYCLSGAIRLLWLPDGDHSFKPRKSSGHTLDENLSTAIREVAAFVRES